MRLKLIRKTSIHRHTDNVRFRDASRSLVSAVDQIVEDVTDPLSLDYLRMKTVADLREAAETLTDEHDDATREYVGLWVPGKYGTTQEVPHPQFTQARKYRAIATDWEAVPFWETDRD